MIDEVLQYKKSITIYKITISKPFLSTLERSVQFYCKLPGSVNPVAVMPVNHYVKFRDWLAKQPTEKFPHIVASFCHNYVIGFGYIRNWDEHIKRSLILKGINPYDT